LRVAVQNILQAPLMAQVAASGLIVSFALTVSMVTMVSSFRTALDQWLDDVLPAPMYMRSKGVPLPADMLAALERPQSPFARVERMATVMLTLDPRRPPVALLVRELDRADPAARLPFTGAVLAAPPGRITAWISEPLQELHGLVPGQTLRLPLLGREVEVFVGGVWRDYARQFGAVVIAAADYRALGGSVAATDLALWPRPGQEDAAGRWMREQAKRHGIEGVGSGEIRELSLSIFDKSFAVTYALEAAAMLIGLFGLAVTLAASVWLRARELATLSALGFDRAMLGRAIVFEGALIAVIGLALGLACGIAVGAILTHVVNPQAFHWRMPLQVPWVQVLLGAALTLAAGHGRQPLRRAPGHAPAGGASAGQRAVEVRHATPQLPAHPLAAARAGRRPRCAALCGGKPCHAPRLPARPRRASGVPHRVVVRHRRAGRRRAAAWASSSPSSAAVQASPKNSTRPSPPARSCSPTPR
jgi:putative ABC transport system permease protein